LGRLLVLCGEHLSERPQIALSVDVSNEVDVLVGDGRLQLVDVVEELLPRIPREDPRPIVDPGSQRLLAKQPGDLVVDPDRIAVGSTAATVVTSLIVPRFGGRICLLIAAFRASAAKRSDEMRM